MLSASTTLVFSRSCNLWLLLFSFATHALLLSPFALFCFPMGRVKSITRVSSGKAHPEATDSIFQEVAEVLSSMNQGSG
jgi:hypothetical protein